MLQQDVRCSWHAQAEPLEAGPEPEQYLHAPYAIPGVPLFNGESRKFMTWNNDGVLVKIKMAPEPKHADLCAK